MATGVVREWHDDLGWGVLDSDETPGGCWAHFSHLSMAGLHQASAGQVVTFTFEPAEQDGFAYRAVDVTIDGVARVEPVVLPPGTAYQSHLDVTWDDADPAR